MNKQTADKKYYENLIKNAKINIDKKMKTIHDAIDEINKISKLIDAYEGALKDYEIQHTKN